MNMLIEAVKASFSPGGVPEVPEQELEVFAEDTTEEATTDEVVVSIKEADSGEALKKIFAAMREKRDAEQEPHLEARQVLLEAIQAEKEIIARADSYSVERAMAEQGDSFDRGELLALRTAADVAEQVVAIKKRELKEITAVIDRIQAQWQRDDSYLQQVCADVVSSRRSAVVRAMQEGLANLFKLDKDRAARELGLIVRCRELLLKHGGDEALADEAIASLVRINLPDTSHHLFWNALTARQKADNPHLEPTTTKTDAATKGGEA